MLLSLLLGLLYITRTFEYSTVNCMGHISMHAEFCQWAILFYFAHFSKQIFESFRMAFNVIFAVVSSLEVITYLSYLW